MPIARIQHEIEFCAAFRLAMPGATEEENRSAFGVCFSPHYHGHNYQLKVTLEGEIDPQTGMVMDYAVLAEIMQRRIFQPLDHKNLNEDVPFLEGIIPTSENLCVAFWSELAPEFSLPIRLVELELRESRDNAVVYHGPDHA